MKLQLYYYDQCPYCQMVLRKIKQLALTEIEFCNVLENPMHRSAHLNKTGRTTVPCLYIDGKPMFESADIVEWLEANKKNLK